MIPEEPIEAALRQRPSDERTYAEPLSPMASDSRVAVRVQPVRRVRWARTRRGAVPTLASLGAVLAIGAGLLLARWPLTAPAVGSATISPTSSPTSGRSPSPIPSAAGYSVVAAMSRTSTPSTGPSTGPRGGWSPDGRYFVVYQGPVGSQSPVLSHVFAADGTPVTQIAGFIVWDGDGAGYLWESNAGGPLSTVQGDLYRGQIGSDVRTPVANPCTPGWDCWPLGGDRFVFVEHSPTGDLPNHWAYWSNGTLGPVHDGAPGELTPDGARMIVSHYDSMDGEMALGWPAVVEPATGKVLRSWPSFHSRFGSGVFSRDGNYVYAGSSILDIATGRIVAIGKDGDWSIGWDASDRMLLADDASRTVTAWSVDGAEHASAIPYGDSIYGSIYLSPSGRAAAIMVRPHTFILWTPEGRQTIELPADALDVAWSPDERSVVICTDVTAQGQEMVLLVRNWRPGS
jgi:hypothetical protein